VEDFDAVAIKPPYRLESLSSNRKASCLFWLFAALSDQHRKQFMAARVRLASGASGFVIEFRYPGRSRPVQLAEIPWNRGSFHRIEVTMIGACPRWTLVGLLLFGLTVPAARAWDWRKHFHIGPEEIPPGPNVPSFYSRDLPDWGPYPPSSYHWPTLRQALDQYGWFGRKGCPQPPVPPSHLLPVEPPAMASSPETLPPPRRASTAFIRVQVPADAEIRFGGQPTTQTGPERLFETPALDPAAGNLYEIQAVWNRQGQKVTRTRTIRISPGDKVNVRFE
jgi:uncharacterized protein (TIGR03000 family)